MNIDLDKQKQYVFGAARIEKDSDGNTLFHRMTKDLFELYSYAEGAQVRAKCSPGVRIAFESNTDFLEFELLYGARARELFAIDVFVDGKQYYSDGPKEYEESYSHKVAGLGSSSKKIEIFLSHCCEVKLRNFEISDQADIRPVERQKTWLAIGDSITQGMQATTPSQTYAAIAARELGYSLHNVAVGGAVINGELGRLANDIEWDIATIAFGTNDFNKSRPLEDVYNDTVKLLKGLMSGGNGKVAIVTSIPWAERTTPNDAGLSLEQYRETIRKAAKQFPECIIIEGPDLIADDLSLFVDNVHPNDAGMRQYANNLVKYLKK